MHSRLRSAFQPKDDQILSRRSQQRAYYYPRLRCEIRGRLGPRGRNALRMLSLTNVNDGWPEFSPRTNGTSRRECDAMSFSPAVRHQSIEMEHNPALSIRFRKIT
jgi:hypothetical protein